MNAQLRSDLIVKIHNKLQKLYKESLEMGSINFYIVKQLEQYLNCLQLASAKKEVESCAKFFGRFCTESLDWDAPEYQECIKLSEEGYKVAKSVENGKKNQIQIKCSEK